MIRPEKVEIFMAMAYTISRLSLDANTKHGCVITNKEHHILGCGFNSFPAGMDDETLIAKGLNKRPELGHVGPTKYDWMIHSERNAISNCERKPKNGIAYVTGICCVDCMQHMWQNGVRQVYMLDRQSFVLQQEQVGLMEDFLEQTKFKPPHKGLEVFKIKPSLNFLLPMVTELKGLGFITDELEKMEHSLEYVGTRK